MKSLRSRLDRLNVLIRILYFVNLLLTFYGYSILLKSIKDPAYESWVDLGKVCSCSRILRSSYIKGFGGIIGKYFGESSILNQTHHIYGFILYSSLLLSSFMNGQLSSKCIFLIKLGVAAYSISILYMLIFVLREMCLIGAINFANNFVLTRIGWIKMKILNDGGATKRKET